MCESIWARGPLFCQPNLGTRSRLARLLYFGPQVLGILYGEWGVKDRNRRKLAIGDRKISISFSVILNRYYNTPGMGSLPAMRRQNVLVRRTSILLVPIKLDLITKQIRKNNFSSIVKCFRNFLFFR